MERRRFAIIPYRILRLAGNSVRLPFSKITAVQRKISNALALCQLVLKSILSVKRSYPGLRRCLNSLARAMENQFLSSIFLHACGFSSCDSFSQPHDVAHSIPPAGTVTVEVRSGHAAARPRPQAWRSSGGWLGGVVTVAAFPAIASPFSISQGLTTPTRGRSDPHARATMNSRLNGNSVLPSGCCGYATSSRAR